LAIKGKDININWLRFTAVPTSSSSLTNPEMKIYPNPAPGGKFTLLLSGFGDREAVNVEIYNMAGQSIYFKKHKINNLVSESIGISEGKLAKAGLYLVSVQSDTETFRQHVLVRE
jgi:hypothetical protein